MIQIYSNGRRGAYEWREKCQYCGACGPEHRTDKASMDEDWGGWSYVATTALAERAGFVSFLLGRMRCAACPACASKIPAPPPSPTMPTLWYRCEYPAPALLVCEAPAAMACEAAS